MSARRARHARKAPAPASARLTLLGAVVFTCTIAGFMSAWAWELLVGGAS